MTKTNLLKAISALVLVSSMQAMAENNWTESVSCTVVREDLETKTRATERLQVADLDMRVENNGQAGSVTIGLVEFEAKLMPNYRFELRKEDNSKTQILTLTIFRKENSSSVTSRSVDLSKPRSKSVSHSILSQRFKFTVSCFSRQKYN